MSELKEELRQRACLDKSCPATNFQLQDTLRQGVMISARKDINA